MKEQMKEQIKEQLVVLLKYNDKKYKEPCIVYSKKIIDIIIKQVFDVISCYDNVKCLYSIKANMNEKIIEYLSNYIDGYDVASWGEYRKVRKVINQDKIISASGYAFNSEQILEILEHNSSFDFISINQLALVASSIQNKEIGIRINCRCSRLEKKVESSHSRFGFCYAFDVNSLNELCKIKNLRIVRIHVHIGEKDLESIDECIEEIEKWTSIFPSIQCINFGGGWDYIFDRGYFDNVINKIASFFSKKTILIEPGSLLVRNSGILISKVIDYKINTFGTGYVALDTSAFNLSSWFKPKIIASIHKGNRIPFINYKLCGNTCYEDDVFQCNITTSVGLDDIEFLYPVGAYYNSTCRSLHGLQFPKEILI